MSEPTVHDVLYAKFDLRVMEHLGIPADFPAADLAKAIASFTSRKGTTMTLFDNDIPEDTGLRQPLTLDDTSPFLIEMLANLANNYGEAGVLSTALMMWPRCTCRATLTLGSVHRTDGPCYTYEPPAPSAKQMGSFQRRSSTSRRAALDVWPKTGTQRERVLEALIRLPITGATDEELADRLGMNPSSVRPRRIELVTGGWVKPKHDNDGGPVERETHSGSMAQVWVPTEQAKAYRHD